MRKSRKPLYDANYVCELGPDEIASDIARVRLSRFMTAIADVGTESLERRAIALGTKAGPKLDAKALILDSAGDGSDLGYSVSVRYNISDDFDEAASPSAISSWPTPWTLGRAVGLWGEGVRWAAVIGEPERDDIKSEKARLMMAYAAAYAWASDFPLGQKLPNCERTSVAIVIALRLVGRNTDREMLAGCIELNEEIFDVDTAEQEGALKDQPTPEILDHDSGALRHQFTVRRALIRVLGAEPKWKAHRSRMELHNRKLKALYERRNAITPDGMQLPSIVDDTWRDAMVGVFRAMSPVDFADIVETVAQGSAPAWLQRVDDQTLELESFFTERAEAAE